MMILTLSTLVVLDISEIIGQVVQDFGWPAGPEVMEGDPLLFLIEGVIEVGS